MYDKYIIMIVLYILFVMFFNLYCGFNKLYFRKRNIEKIDNL